MPSIDSHVYAIRIDGDEQVYGLIEFLEADGGAHLAVRETVEGGNPHGHAILRSHRNIATLRAALRRFFPDLVGNRAYSLALVKDIDRYERYMLKGDSASSPPEVIAAYGFQYGDLAWQDNQHAAYWEEHQATEARRRTLPLVEFVLNACKDANIQWHDKHAIAVVYIREAVARKKSINTFAVRAQVNLIQCQLCPDDQAIQDLASAVVGV